MVPLQLVGTVEEAQHIISQSGLRKDLYVAVVVVAANHFVEIS